VDTTRPNKPTADSPLKDRVAWIARQLPSEGLFAGQRWRLATTPFPIERDLARALDTLGRVLLKFYQAVERLHRLSSEGKQPSWIATLLDQGKPERLLQWQQARGFRNHLPCVIRPDILLTESGFSITELDSVPGGIGLTAWLNQVYAGLTRPEDGVIGGERGMMHGFSGIFGKTPRVHLMVSEESATYRPEMKWLAERLGPDRFKVRDADFDGVQPGEAVYRFFELFDLDNVPAAAALFDRAEQGEILCTPPPRPIFEEKLLFGLLWNRNLEGFWHRELGEGFLRRLQQAVPCTWILDPTPLPPHAVFPRLQLTEWPQLKALSQKQRELILKISGFAPTAWGARGVYLGSDLSQADWSAAVDQALAAWPSSPYILQEYHKPALVQADWFDQESGRVQKMEGRVRLCPYYFVHGEGQAARTHLGGVLATICPPDKKIIHGMTDAILAPCRVNSASPVIPKAAGVPAGLEPHRS